MLKDASSNIRKEKNKKMLLLCCYPRAFSNIVPCVVWHDNAAEENCQNPTEIQYLQEEGKFITADKCTAKSWFSKLKICNVRFKSKFQTYFPVAISLWFFSFYKWRRKGNGIKKYFWDSLVVPQPTYMTNKPWSSWEQLPGLLNAYILRTERKLYHCSWFVQKKYQ